MTYKTGQNPVDDSGEGSTVVFLPDEQRDEEYPLKRRGERTRTSIERILAFVRVRPNMNC